MNLKKIEFVNEKYSNIAGVVLAGGKCTRYGGKNKALLEIENQTFYQKTVGVLDQIFNQVLVITNSPEEFPEDSIPKYKDVIKDIGPLGGIHAALTNLSHAEAIFVVAVDMPFLNDITIREMVEKYKQQKCDILIPELNNNIEPLAAIYSQNIFKKLDEYLNSSTNYSIRSFFKYVDTKFYQLDDNTINEQSFYNINSPKDFEQIIKNKQL